MNTKKNKDNGEACPIEINNPWASYKSGDTKENNNILPDGYNL